LVDLLKTLEFVMSQEIQFGQDDCLNCGWDKGAGIDLATVKRTESGDGLCPQCGEVCQTYDYRELEADTDEVLSSEEAEKRFDAALHVASGRGGRISKEELRRHFEQCVNDTSSLPNTKESFIGFICGFRAYEKMATALRLNLSDADSKRFVTVSK